MKKQLPSLNGLRAISILLVIFNHYSIYYRSHFNASRNWEMIFDGQLGVNIFFIISGYLITTLLLQEERVNTDVSLKNFYIRRTLRIFPAYYFLLLIYLVLQVSGVFTLSKASWLTSLTYTKYFNVGLDNETDHFWSLSIEEHFYLFWPLAFKLFKPLRNKIALFIIIIVPIIRVLDYKFGNPNIDDFKIFTRMDALMWGCLFALNNNKIVDIIKKFTAKNKLLKLIPFIIIPLSVLFTVLNKDLRLGLGVLVVAFGQNIGTITSICIGLIILISLNYSNNLWYRFLNHPFINYVGKLSYSLYLWQQVFMFGRIGYFSTPPFNIIFIFLMASFSFHFIEKPFMKLKTKYAVESENSKEILIPALKMQQNVV